MRELDGSATTTVSAPPADSFALVLALDAYPSWCPAVVRRAEVTERADDGTPRLASATVHLGVGPLQRDFDLTIAVAAEPERVVRLTSAGGSGPELSMTWHVSGGPPTELRLELEGRLDVPRFLPLGGVGNAVAEQLVAAARAGSSPEARRSPGRAARAPPPRPAARRTAGGPGGHG